MSAPSLSLRRATGLYTGRDGRSFAIRTCAGFAELDACVALQIATWGYGDMDVVPRRLFLLAQKIGGQVIGAFAGDALAGFAMALPAVDPDRSPYLHSHMLAVLPEYRDAGLGRALKLAQRDEALGRGLLRMEWTFDPLETKNAYLNIHRLGVVVRRYSPNFYGVSSSRLQAGLPTDRLHAEWRLASARVHRKIEGETVAARWPLAATIVVPAAAAAWKQQLEQAQRLAELQTANRERFQDAFARGLAVAGFRRDQHGNGIYELTEWSRLQPELDREPDPAYND